MIKKAKIVNRVHVEMRRQVQEPKLVRGMA